MCAARMALRRPCTAWASERMGECRASVLPHQLLPRLDHDADQQANGVRRPPWRLEPHPKRDGDKGRVQKLSHGLHAAASSWSYSITSVMKTISPGRTSSIQLKNAMNPEVSGPQPHSRRRT